MKDFKTMIRIRAAARFLLDGTGVMFCLALMVTILLAATEKTAMAASCATAVTGCSFLVDVSTDEHDANPGDGVCDIGGGHCTLRAAIEEGNVQLNPVLSPVPFKLVAPHMITFSTPLVTLTNGGGLAMQASFTITGILGVPVINGNGQWCFSLTDSGTVALNHDDGADGSTFGGLTIQGCNGDGITANGHGFTFLNNFILNNSQHGISIGSSRVYPDTSSNFLISLNDALPIQPVDSSKIVEFSSKLVTALGSFTRPVMITGNVIAGNGQNGIDLTSENLSGVIISGNMIGTDPTGNLTTFLGNSTANNVGISLKGKTFGNLIGPDNVISGNTTEGIRVEPGAVFLPNFIMGNRIGLAATDSSAHIGNGNNGIYVSSTPSTDITHFNPSSISVLIGPGNLISDNKGAPASGDLDTIGSDGAGVYITASSGVKVVGNTIGMAEFNGTPDTTKNFGNAGDGIRITSSGNTIGGSSSSDANIIAANARHGILVNLSSTSGIDIKGNYIGGPGVGNGGDGIHIDRSNGINIGGPGDTDFNTIAGNGRNGIALRNSTSDGLSNLMQRNRIFGNATLLAGVGIDLNHASNAVDTADQTEFYNNYANMDQNQPIICLGSEGAGNPCQGSQAASYSLGNTTVDWTLYTHGPATFRVEFFAIDNANDNTATGMTFLGEQTVTTDGPTSAFGTTLHGFGGTTCSGSNPGRCTSIIPANAGGKYILMTATDVTEILLQPGGDWMSALKCFAGNNGVPLMAPCYVNDTSEFSTVVAVPANNANPAAVDDSGAGYSVLTGGTLNMSAPGVLANDSDPDGDTLTASKLTDPSHGTVVVNGDGSFTYNSTDPGYTGTDSFSYTASDGHGGTASATVTILVAASASSTALSPAPSPNPSTYGQSVTFTAAVTGSSPTGSVAFQDGGVNITGCGAIALTAGQAQCATAVLTAGNHDITAIYSGDAGNAASTSPIVVQVVNKVNTATTINAHTPDPSYAGAAVLVTVNVAPLAPGAGTPGGKVTVIYGAANCVITLPATSCTLPGVISGTITATYSSDSNFAGSQGTVSHTVQAAGATGTATAVTVVNPLPGANTIQYAAALYGQSVDVTAEVTRTGASGSPDGDVTITAGGSSCTAALTPGDPTSTVTCTLPAPAVAGTSYLVTANYAGTGTFAPGTSSGTADGGLTVTKASTSIAITNDLSAPTDLGVPFAVNASVSVTAPAAGTPTGTITVSDGTGDTCTITLPATSCNLTPLTSGAKTITATYGGDGNLTGSTSAGVPHSVSAVSGTALASSSNPSVFGQSVTFTATVTGNTPTGTVAFQDGGSDISGCASQLLSGGQAQCTVSDFTVAAHNITAVYSGDVNNAGSTSNTVAQIVNMADTTTTINSHTPDPSNFGTQIAVDASVAVNLPGAGTPTGTITVSDGTDTCTITLPATSCNLTPSSAGAKTLTATYNGDTDFNISTSAGVSHNVNAVSTTTALSSSSNPSVFGQSVTFTATITGNSPTGTVEFQNGGTDITGCSSVNLSGGQAQCSVSNLIVASHNITAIYSGDGNNLGSTSIIVTQVVNKAGTTTTINSHIPNPSTIGTAIAVDASVAVNLPGGGTPSGSITVSDGTANCTITLPATSCNLSPLTAGLKTLTATFGGNANFNTSTSAGVSHTVNATFPGAPTGVSATAGNAQATVAFTAPLNDGGSAILIYAATSTPGSITGSCNVPCTSINVTGLTNGTPYTFMVKATNGIGPGPAGGPSNSVTPMTGATSTGLNSSANPSVFGQSVTFTATVNGGISPTGSMAFKDGATNITGCGSILLSSGQAQCSTNALSVNSHNITAVYSGDSNNNGSTSSILTQVVNKAATTTTISGHVPNPSAFGAPIAMNVSTVAVAPGSGTPTGTITVSDGTANCTITLPASSCNLTPTSAGAKTLTATYSGDGNFSGSTSAGVSHTVNVAVAPPSISKSFSPASIAVGSVATLSFTITNPNGSALTGVGFTDNFPGGLAVSTPNSLSGLCGGGTITAVADSSSVSLSGATLSGGASCTFSVSVTATSAGVKSNVTGTVTSNEGGTGGTASASLNVTGPQTVNIPAATGNGTITLTTNSPGCFFSNVAAFTEAQVSNDPSNNYPYGLVGFTLSCASADVTITFPGSLAGTTYRKYGPTTPGDAGTTQWYDFPGQINGNSITLHLTDGQLGDDTAVDGIIVDQGGPGAPPTAPASAVAVPTMNEWGMIIFMTLAALGSMYYLRRRRV